MQPDLDIFRKTVNKYRGNLTKVALAFGVTRTTVGLWMNTNDEWKQVVRDARMRLFDDCLVSAEMTALGIPAKETDEEGHERFVGWVERPDGQMLRYLLSTLGQHEGFGDTLETAMDKPLEGVVPKKIEVNVVYNSKEDLDLQEQKVKAEETEG